MTKTHLTPRESQVLQLLSTGTKSVAIRERLNISAPNLDVVLYRIRNKTGIVDTKDAIECRSFLRQPARIRAKDKAALPISETQLLAMRQRARGLSYSQIAANLGIGAQTVQNHVYHGCKRANIKGQGHNRTDAIRAYIERLDGPSLESILDEY